MQLGEVVLVEIQLADWVRAGKEAASYKYLASDTRRRISRIRANPESAHASSLAQVIAILTANVRILAMMRNDPTGKYTVAREELEALLAEIEALNSKLFPADQQERGTSRRGQLR